MSQSKITDAELSALPIHDAVTSIDLSYTPIGNKGLENFSRGKNVERLILAGTQVTDAGLTHLKQMPSLKTVSLDRTSVSTEAQLELLRFLANRPEKTPSGQP
ncbi:MAG: hypothetical protein K8T91_17350 [Planctomycetes bacterium]|nr:hypothetical protein [Planctomycetota bacterium]